MRKIILFFLIFPFLVFGQTQIGQNIIGEADSDHSGYSVSLSSNGSIIAIGAIGNNGNGISSGHVRVYENNQGVWTQIGQDIDGEQQTSASGSSVSLSSDGSILAIGASGNTGVNGIYSGHVRVYENNQGTWIQIGQDIDGEYERDFSGYCVSLSSNGSIVAIGGPGNDENGNNSGHVRVYENNEGVWTQIGDDIDGESSYDESGKSNSLSLSSNGSIVAIGGWKNNDNGNGSGHVRIYENNEGIWTQIGDDIDGELQYENLGKSVSLSSDGSIVAIGALGNNTANPTPGYVKIYKNISGIWTQIGQNINGQSVYSDFAYALSLSGDGTLVAIGARRANSWAGKVQLYKNIDDTWTKIGTDIIGESAYESSSGEFVSISTDKSTLAIGCSGNNGNIFPGYTKVYDVSELLSVEDFKIDNFLIYPNPTTTIINIDLKENSELEKVTIYNALGQIVLTSKEDIINTSKLASGSYIVEVLTKRGKSTKKLIIN